MTPEELNALKREARKQGTSAARLLELAALESQISRSIAKAVNTPTSVLEQLARSTDLTTRKLVAANPTTPPALLEILAKDRQWTVLKAVAENPHTPPGTLERLARHKQHTVKTALLNNPHLPLAALLVLNQDTDVRVRSAVLVQENMPVPLKREALDHPEAEVRASALLGLAGHEPHRGGLAETDLRMAAQDQDERVRHEAACLLDRDDLAFHRLIPPIQIEDLANQFLSDEDPTVRLAATRRASPTLIAGTLLPMIHKPGYDAARTLIDRTNDAQVTQAILALNDEWLLHYLAEHTQDASSYDHLLQLDAARDYLPRNNHIPEQFWIQVGEQVLRDAQFVKAYLPLVKRALLEGNERPSLLAWFTENLRALLALIPTFVDEVFDWRTFNESDVRFIAHKYLYHDQTRPLAEKILATLPKGATP